MPISVNCPECEAPYKVPDDAAGKAIKCKKCGAKITIPGGNGGGEAGSEGAAPKKKGGMGKMLAIIGGVLLLGCCCCVMPGTGGLAYFMGWIPGVGASATPLALGTEKKDKIISSDSKVDFGLAEGGKKNAKLYTVKLESGKKYVIDMKADVRPPKLDKIDPKDFLKVPHDPFLRLLDPSGKKVAENDDVPPDPKKPEPNLDSQIRYSATTTGDFTIQATYKMALPDGGMGYTISVKLE
jgi:predicted Zn finger-like uncharacterized protein